MATFQRPDGTTYRANFPLDPLDVLILDDVNVSPAKKTNFGLLLIIGIALYSYS